MDKITVLIATIGKYNQHVEFFLDSDQGVNVKKVFLIHTTHKQKMPTNGKITNNSEVIDFGHIAKQFKTKLEKKYLGRKKIESVVIKNAQDIVDTQEAILNIVDKLKDDNTFSNSIALDFAGGTNAMSSGAILAASKNRIRAFYVLFDDGSGKDLVTEVFLEMHVDRQFSKPARKYLQIICDATFNPYYGDVPVEKRTEPEVSSCIRGHDLKVKLNGGRLHNPTIQFLIDKDLIRVDYVYTMYQYVDNKIKPSNKSDKLYRATKSGVLENKYYLQNLR